jgi:3-hydroxyisobutyrate dehydrogenase/glyoxylate/succinic semialdehyde reductase
MVSNLLLGAGMAAFAEGMVLGQSLGIPQERLFEMLLGGAVVPAFASGKRAKIETDDFEADFPIRWMHKDLQLASETAYEQGISLPVINTVKEAYAMAIRQGYGAMDFSAIYAYLHNQQGEPEQ